MNELKKELLEVIYAILPVTLVIVLLQIALVHMPLTGPHSLYQSQRESRYGF